MKVMHVASGDLWAGAEAMVSQLLPALRDLGETEVGLVAFNEGRMTWTVAECGIPVHLLPESSLSPMALARELESLLGRERPEIVHVHDYKEQILGGWGARGSRCRLVRTVHGLPESASGLAGLKMRLYRALEGASLRGSDAVIAVSESMVPKLMRRGIHPRRIHVVHNGMYLDGLPAVDRSEVRRQYGVPEGVPLLGWAGRLTPVKRVHHVLELAAKLRAAGQSFFVIVAGDGPLRGDLERMAASLQLEPNVRFTGHVERIRELIGSLDLIVMTSEHEGIPMVLIEALSMGVPVVAYAVGGIPEVVEDGRQGVLVPPGDLEGLANAVQTLFSEPQTRFRMGRAGMERARECFSASSMARRTRDVYRKVLDPDSVQC